jgi:uncharacterized protein YciI
MIRSLLILFMLAIAGPSAKGQNSTPVPGLEKTMKTYYLVLLKKGPVRDQDSLTVTQIQAGHMAHLEKMHKENRMCLAGPMAVSHDIRGICVYNTASLEEAVKFANEDPAIKSGRLIAEVIPWYSESGNCLP